MLLFTATVWTLWRQRRTRTATGAYACVPLTMTAFGTISCGNGSASGGNVAPAIKPISETGTVTVTAVSSTAQKSVKIPVSVQ